jgi:hypothetical protein
MTSSELNLPAFGIAPQPSIVPCVPFSSQCSFHLWSSGSGTGSTQPREHNRAATWKRLRSRNSDYGLWDPPRWQRDTLSLQKLALTSSTGGGRSVGIVRSRTQATEFSLCRVELYENVRTINWNRTRESIMDYFKALKQDFSGDTEECRARLNY